MTNSSKAEQYFECFCCAKNFTQKESREDGVVEDYTTQYCGSECFEDFSAFLKAGAARARAAGLVDDAGEVIRESSHANKSNVLNLLEQYKIKVTP